MGRAAFSSSLYEADSTLLEPGDELTMEERGDSEDYGFILIDDRPSMNAIYRTSGRKARISRFGGTGFDVNISLLERVKRDSVLQGFWAAFIFITGLHISRSQKGGSPG
jgi:hypothetical protein